MTAPLDPPRHLVAEAVARALAEDLGPLGDLTAALIPAEQHGVADFVARRAGVLAGTACATEAFAQLDPSVDLEWRVLDGAALDAGTVIGTVGGPLRSVLTGERTALNFLCHLSGVATATRAFVDALDGRARVLETRKTLPGLRALEKAAVRAGGGVNHRGSLSDMVLVKDNHLAIGGIDLQAAVTRAREELPGVPVEVEADDLAGVRLALKVGADRILLDNMDEATMREAVKLCRGHAITEASGGMDLESVARAADCGVDCVSVGALTHSSPALDLALDLD